MVAIKGKQYKLDFNKNKKLDKEDFDILNKIKIKKRKRMGASKKVKIAKDTKPMPNPFKDKQKKYRKPIKK